MDCHIKAKLFNQEEFSASMTCVSEIGTFESTTHELFFCLDDEVLLVEGGDAFSVSSSTIEYTEIYDIENQQILDLQEEVILIKNYK